MNKDLIIKIALGVSIAAVLFSVVTLIRAFIIHSTVVFPIIQVIGSLLIAAICWYLFSVLRKADFDEEPEEDQQTEQSEIGKDTADETLDTELPQEDDSYRFSNFTK